MLTRQHGLSAALVTALSISACQCVEQSRTLDAALSPRDAEVSDVVSTDAVLHDSSQIDVGERGDGAEGDAGSADATADSGPRMASRELCITNADRRVSVFDALQDGDGPPLREFGSVTGLLNPFGIALDTVHDEIFVANAPPDSIQVFGRTASGNVAPLRSIQAVGIPIWVAVDPANDEIFVGTDEVLVFSRTASGSAQPLRVLMGPSDELQRAIAYDATHGEIYVARAAITSTAASISVYARTASGLATPIRSFSGSGARSAPAAIAIDAAHDEVLVFEGRLTGAIDVYPRTANGQVEPIRTISGVDLNGHASMIAVDVVNDEIFVTKGPGSAGVVVFSRTQNGVGTAIRTLEPFTGQSPNKETGVAVDPQHGEVILGVLDRDAIAIYPRSASGDATPLRVISGEASGVSSAGIATDSTNQEIVISDFEFGSINVFPLDASGAVSPVRSIRGAPDVFGPGRLGVLPARGEIFVLSNRNSLLVFPRTQNSSAAAARQLDPNMYQADDLALDPIHGELFLSGVSSTATSSNQVRTYDLTASGSSAPKRILTAAGLDGSSIAIDEMHDEIFSLNATLITVYSRTAGLDSQPIRTIGPIDLRGGAIRVDPIHDELHVSSPRHFAILTFSRTANGNVQPLRTIAGPSTRLIGIGDLAICR